MLPDEDVATWRPEVIEEDPEADAFEFHDADEVPDDEVGRKHRQGTPQNVAPIHLIGWQDAEAAAIVNDIRGKVLIPHGEQMTKYQSSPGL